MAEGFKKVPVMAWDFQNLFFCGCQPKKNVPVMAWDFQNFFCGCQPKKKQGASYGMSISKPYFLGGAHLKNRCQLWHWNYKALLLFGDLPKKWCQLWHGICLIFIWGASQKKVAISGMESSPKNVPVMACFCPLFINHKKSVPVMAWKPIPLYLFRGGPIHLFMFGVLLTTATTKNTPAHPPLFSKKPQLLLLQQLE